MDREVAEINETLDDIENSSADTNDPALNAKLKETSRELFGKYSEYIATLLSLEEEERAEKVAAEEADLSDPIVNTSESIELSEEPKDEEIAVLDVALKELNKLLLEQPGKAVERTTIETRETEAVAPVFGDVLDKKLVRYRMSEAVIFTRYADEVGCNYQGLLLNKGEYKLKYTASTYGKESRGLALFDTRKKFKKLLSWQSLGGYWAIINQNGEAYININEPSILAVTDNSTAFMPDDFRGTITVTIYEIRRPPY